MLFLQSYSKCQKKYWIINLIGGYGITAIWILQNLLKPGWRSSSYKRRNERPLVSTLNDRHFWLLFRRYCLTMELRHLKVYQSTTNNIFFWRSPIRRRRRQTTFLLSRLSMICFDRHLHRFLHSLKPFWNWNNNELVES